MIKDVDRLKLVSDRFGKIGSTPQLEEKDIIEQIKNMVVYIKTNFICCPSFDIFHHIFDLFNNILFFKLGCTANFAKPVTH